MSCVSPAWLQAWRTPLSSAPSWLQRTRRPVAVRRSWTTPTAGKSSSCQSCWLMTGRPVSGWDWSQRVSCGWTSGTDCWSKSAWTAGSLLKCTLHILSRNAEEDEQCFQMCLQSLVEEITFNAGHLLTVEEPQRELVDQSEPPKLPLKKPGRGFRHALTKLYINEAGRQTQWFLLQVQFGRCSKISQKWTCLSLVKPLETNPRTLTHQTEMNQPPHFSCAE